MYDSHMQSTTQEAVAVNTPKAYMVTLRDGRSIRIGDMSASRLKYLRRNGGKLTLKNTEHGAEISFDGKEIKKILVLPFNQ